MKLDMWKSPTKSASMPAVQGSAVVSKKRSVNFDKYQIYQLSENIIVSTPEKKTPPDEKADEGGASASFYLAEDPDSGDDVPGLVDVAALGVDSVAASVSKKLSPDEDELPQTSGVPPTESHEGHPHHCLGYEVHPLVSTNELSLAHNIERHAGSCESVGEAAGSIPMRTPDVPSVVQEPDTVQFLDQESNKARSFDTLLDDSSHGNSNLLQPQFPQLHKVLSAPATLPLITILPASPEQFELTHRKLNTAAGLKFALNSSPVYSLPLPDDVMHPSSPTNITPTKLSTSPNKSGIPFSGSSMVRRSSESDLSTPPKGEVLQPISQELFLLLIT